MFYTKYSSTSFFGHIVGGDHKPPPQQQQQQKYRIFPSLSVFPWLAFLPRKISASLLLVPLAKSSSYHSNFPIWNRKINPTDPPTDPPVVAPTGTHDLELHTPNRSPFRGCHRWSLFWTSSPSPPLQVLRNSCRFYNSLCVWLLLLSSSNPTLLTHVISDQAL